MGRGGGKTGTHSMHIAWSDARKVKQSNRDLTQTSTRTTGRCVARGGGGKRRGGGGGENGKEGGGNGGGGMFSAMIRKIKKKAN